MPDVLGQLLVDNLLHHAADALDKECDIIINPLSHGEGGGGAVRPPLPFFLPVTQNYHEAPIPENS